MALIKKDDTGIEINNWLVVAFIVLIALLIFAIFSYHKRYHPKTTYTPSVKVDTGAPQTVTGKPSP